MITLVVKVPVVSRNILTRKPSTLKLKGNLAVNLPNFAAFLIKSVQPKHSYQSLCTRR